MFLVTWVFDKLGYMPKVSIDTNWPFPATQQEYAAPDFEKPVAKKVAKKTAKISKATTRKTKTK